MSERWTTTAPCPACGQRLRVRKDGFMWRHDADGDRCPGSFAKPTATVHTRAPVAEQEVTR